MTAVTLDLFDAEPASMSPDFRGTARTRMGAGDHSPLADAVPPYAPGSDTSQAAALSMVRDAPRLRAAVLAVLERHPGGLTSDEIAGELGESVLSIRPRVTELKQAGQLEDTGERRANRSGRTAAVVRLKKAARAA